MPKKGTVVLVPFPFTDLSGFKVRPAVVISNVALGEDVIVVFVSSKETRIRKSDMAVSPSETNGIKIRSVIKCAKIATLEKKIILGELGVLEPSVMKVVESKLRLVLGM